METLETLSSRIETTEEVGSIVHTMKAVSAVSIRQYDQAVLALKDYHRTIELGLQVVLRDERTEIRPEREKEGRTAAIVFGSDRGLCGGFNRSVVDLAAGEFGRATKGAEAPLIVAVGARAAARLESVGLPPTEVFFLPGSVAGLTRTAQSILIQADRWREEEGVATIRIFANHRTAHVQAEPAARTLVPISTSYMIGLAKRPWPTRQLPTFTMAPGQLLSWLIRQHLFVTVYHIGARSLASEHASRLASMQAAERNIAERLDELTAAYRRTRQDAITTELMDIVAGAEAMREKEAAATFV
ncbi:MAG: F0F1 ATP synthase subunit gamma [Alphaproteobacteria bacterium]|nr:F0F1 ATP synthase subunit gamma [Alphaproteobacteria bacterium]